MLDLDALTATEIFSKNLRNYFDQASMLYDTFFNAFDIHAESIDQKEALYRYTGSGANNLILLSFSQLFKEQKPQLEFDYVSIKTVCKTYHKKAKLLADVCMYRDEDCFEQIDGDTSDSTLFKQGVFLHSRADDMMAIIIVDNRTIKVQVIEEG